MYVHLSAVIRRYPPVQVPQPVIVQLIKALGMAFQNPAWGSLLHVLLAAAQKCYGRRNHLFGNIISIPCDKVTFPIPARRARVWAPSSTSGVTLIPRMPPLMSALITRRDVISLAQVQQEVLGNRLRLLIWRLICPGLWCRRWAQDWMTGVLSWWKTRW